MSPAPPRGNRFILRNHLEAMWDASEDERPTAAIGDSIVDDPQAHLDALVDAGVLRRCPCIQQDAGGGMTLQEEDAYEVVQ